MVNVSEAAFPALRSGNYHITSPSTNRYNCIAWAGGDAANWWWPVGESRFYWPPGVPREETLSAFTAAFSTLGYVRCDAGDLEHDSEKVALCANANGFPTHAARQLDNGRWTSKLGELEDIEHDLFDLQGDIYGAVAGFLKRPRSSAPLALSSTTAPS